MTASASSVVILMNKPPVLQSNTANRTKSSGEKLPNGKDEILQIDTYDAQIVTIKAVQELILKVESLEKENKMLKEELSDLSSNKIRKEISDLKAELQSISEKLQASAK